MSRLLSAGLVCAFAGQAICDEGESRSPGSNSATKKRQESHGRDRSLGISINAPSQIFTMSRLRRGHGPEKQTVCPLPRYTLSMLFVFCRGISLPAVPPPHFDHFRRSGHFPYFCAALLSGSTRSGAKPNLPKERQSPTSRRCPEGRLTAPIVSAARTRRNTSSKPRHRQPPFSTTITTAGPTLLW